ncbi:hypothetical protein SEA_GUEY18_4 [Gordonia phage Guey18]|nr:hypothetical protein SEA_GUEY18_4 [Gordonia phage Guey18]
MNRQNTIDNAAQFMFDELPEWRYVTFKEMQELAAKMYDDGLLVEQPLPTCRVCGRRVGGGHDSDCNKQGPIPRHSMRCQPEKGFHVVPHRGCYMR